MSESSAQNRLADFIHSFADSHLYIGAALLLTVISTTLLVTNYIDQTNWVNLTEWVWASVVGGGALAAYRK